MEELGGFLSDVCLEKCKHLITNGEVVMVVRVKKSKKMEKMEKVVEVVYKTWNGRKWSPHGRDVRGFEMGEIFRAFDKEGGEKVGSPYICVGTPFRQDTERNKWGEKVLGDWTCSAQIASEVLDNYEKQLHDPRLDEDWKIEILARKKNLEAAIGAIK